jgi:rhamnose utilization protein RhaD (predicted bifunctional aldolase and dehydrogenase)
MVNHLQALQNMSFFAGNRFDLVQAGGGNTSVKLDDHRMLVKASGINLTEVTQNSGHVAVDYRLIRTFLSEFDHQNLDKKQREVIANESMLSSKLSTNGKPSIETFLHAMLNTYTLHTHPVSVNVLASKQNWKEALSNIWPDAIFVPYQTPGIDLAMAMSHELTVYMVIHNCFPKVVFLQNHGLIVSSNDPNEVITLTDQVSEAIEKHLNLDLHRYRDITHLQLLLSKVNSTDTCITCSDDTVINSLLSKENKDTPIWPFCPDTLIYCGVRPAFLDSISDEYSLQDYFKRYKEHPKVIILNGTVYFCANSIKKAKESEELLKFHLLVVASQNPQSIERLTLPEVAYLSNWEAEKFRQGV